MPNQTGPVTEAGKAVVSRNAVRHGAYAAPDIALPNEAPGMWTEFSDAVIDNLAPEGAVEEALAQRVAISLWRLRRIPLAEALAVGREARKFVKAEEDRRKWIEQDREALPEGHFYRPGPPPTTEIVAPTEVLPPEAMRKELVRYEAHLNRQLMHALHELEAMQQRRNGNTTPLARMDVTGDKL